MNRESTLDHIARRWNVDLSARPMPIVIPNVGRDDLACLFAELEFRRGVEIGVKEGDYSAVLCQSNPRLEQLWSIDPYLVREDYNDGHRTQQVFDGYFRTAAARLASYPCEIVRDFSLQAVTRFSYNSLDFVYIDGHHNLQNAINDICEWSKRVREGGIIAGHDYVPYLPASGIHVIQAVHAFTEAYQIRPWFVLGTKAVVDGQVRDRHRSFCWVKGPPGLEERGR